MSISIYNYKTSKMIPSTGYAKSKTHARALAHLSWEHPPPQDDFSRPTRQPRSLHRDDPVEIRKQKSRLRGTKGTILLPLAFHGIKGKIDPSPRQS
jgi:hypothetical protein